MKKNIYLLIIVLIFGLSAYFYYNFAYVQLPLKINRLKTEIMRLNEGLISAQILARELDQVAKLIEHNLALSAKDSLAEDASMPFMNGITEEMEVLGIMLLKLDPGRKINMRDYIKSPYRMTVECTYEELGQFINRLEKSDRLITLDGFEIDNAIRKIRDTAEKKSKANAHKIELSISTLTLIKR